MSASPSPASPSPAVPPPAGAAPLPQTPAQRRRQRLKLLAILLVCAAPVIASYLAYYVMPPLGRTNFGDLIEPQRPIPNLRLSGADGAAFKFESLRGRWVLLQFDSGRCDPACVDKLYAMRQQRTMTGKDRERVERVWLIGDAAVPADTLASDYAGTVVLRADPAELSPVFPVEAGRRLEDYLYLIDPRGNLMMRFPATGEPARIRKDLGRLLKASRVG
jgi:cytochrome oxidase Cu insertion factor (SCO1/SenC/PrrC family)